jgi:hypothetical protein
MSRVKVRICVVGVRGWGLCHYSTGAYVHGDIFAHISTLQGAPMTHCGHLVDRGFIRGFTMRKIEMIQNAGMKGPRGGDLSWKFNIM